MPIPGIPGIPDIPIPGIPIPGTPIDAPIIAPCSPPAMAAKPGGAILAATPPAIIPGPIYPGAIIDGGIIAVVVFIKDWFAIVAIC